MSYKRLPLDKKAIEEMRTSTPDIYTDMVGRFGEDNVMTNLLVDYVILTEDKNTVRGMGGVRIDITRDLIYEAKNVNNSAFNKYLKEPINKLKGWIANGDSTLGYTPMILNHDQVQTRVGYILGGSYRTMDLPDENGKNKLHLLCKAVLIDPEAKFKYLNGLYREVSPTIAGNRLIREVSVVNVPAQLTNTSLSAAESTAIETVITEAVHADDWSAKIAEAKKNAHMAMQEAKIKQKDSIAQNLVEGLLRKGVITSPHRKLVTDMFVQLSSGDESMVANVLSKVKESPLNRKPRQVYVQGNMYMNKSKDDRFLEFSKENASKYANSADMCAAFDKFEATAQVSLSAGVGEVIDPMGDVVAKLAAMKDSGALTDEHRAALAPFCTHAVSLEGGAAPAVGDGSPTDGGGIETPNNTSLSAPADAAQGNLVEVLQAGFEAQKSRAEQLNAENEVLKAQVAKIKQDLGV